MSGAKLGASGVCDQLAVVDQVRWSLTLQRLVDKSGQLVVDTKDWQVHQYHYTEIRDTTVLFQCMSMTPQRKNAVSLVIFIMEESDESYLDQCRARTRRFYIDSVDR